MLDHQQAFGLGLSVASESGPLGLPQAVAHRLGTQLGPADRVVEIRVSPQRRCPGYWIVSVDGEQPMGHANDVDELASLIVDTFHSRLFDHCRRLSPPLLVVHAGVVAIDGLAVVIPGVSMSGKSTLVAELVQRGATYLSDEFAMFDNNGNVWPYPRPIALRDPGSTDRPTPQPGLPARIQAGPVPVGLLVDTSFAAGAVWNPTTVVGAAAMLPLLAQGAGIRDQPEQALEIAASLSAVPLLRSKRGEAAAAATALIDTVRELAAL